VNKNIGKGIGNPTNKYRTGDVIWQKTTLGSPGVGWVPSGSINLTSSISDLYKALYGNAPNNWIARDANFGTSQIMSISYGNGVWVAAGDSGSLRTSSDNGVTWVTQTSNFGSTQIKSITYGNSLWVAGGDSGQIRTSTNTVTWVTQTTFSTTELPVGLGTVVAAGSGGSIKTSTDSITWVTQVSNFGTTDALTIAYGNNLYVVGGGAGTIRTSVDGTTWVTQTSNFGTSQIQMIAYGNGLFVASGVGGTIRTSTNGAVWVTQTSNFGSTTIKSITYGNSLWVAGGDGGTLRTSTDAVTWTTRTSNITDSINGVAYGNGVWVAAGGLNATSNSIRSSTDAITWTTRVSNFGAVVSIKTLAFGGTQFVAAGESGQLRTSSDGITWVTRTSNLGTTANTLFYGNGLWFLGAGTLASVTGTIRTSTDAITWVTVGGTLFNSLPPYGIVSNYTTAPITIYPSINSVAYANGLWVSGGSNGTIRTSVDGANWSIQTSNFGASAINTVSYRDGIWVASGGGGALRTSTDTVTWITQVSNFGTSDIYSSFSGLTRTSNYTRKNTRFDYYIESSFDTDTETFSNEFKAWLVRKDTNDPLQGIEAATDLTELYGPSELGANGLVFEHPGNIVSITLGESAETASTRTWVMDSTNDLGSDAEKYYASYTNLNYLGYNWPMLESAVTGRDLPANKDTDVLPYAKAIGYRLSPPIGQYNVTVNGSLEPTVGTYKPGDWCVVVVGDQFINNRLKPPYENRQDILVRKIKSFKVNVPDNPQFPEVVDLELVPEWEAPE
jgi:hypothetical protein